MDHGLNPRGKFRDRPDYKLIFHYPAIENKTKKLTQTHLEFKNLCGFDE